MEGRRGREIESADSWPTSASDRPDEVCEVQEDTESCFAGRSDRFFSWTYRLGECGRREEGDWPAQESPTVCGKSQGTKLE